MNMLVQAHRSFPKGEVGRPEPVPSLIQKRSVDYARAVECLRATLPFGVGDATAGAENELLAVVIGPPDRVDLVRAIEESNYFKNLMRRAAAGDVSRSLERDLKSFLANNPQNAWENSWVCFPRELITGFAQRVFEQDLLADKRVGGARRSDAARFEVQRNGVRCLRIPVSYLLKLALADVISLTDQCPLPVRESGERLMRHFLNDNTSPETFSFHIVGPAGSESLGRDLAEETLRRLLLVRLLSLYANEKFELRSRGQETLVCLDPLTPTRQKRLNELIPDSFYRELFMSPCLSGWDRGEEKYRYMVLCHEALSRSRLNTLVKLRECGILTRNLVTLPTLSNTSLTNNGTHISIGSRLLTGLMAAGSPDFSPEAEKRIGDLVVKIVEHFLPLFVGTYFAAPHRFDFHDFHAEEVLGFLPHELDFTHLRMVWRRWKKKADLKFLGIPLTPFGPRNLDRVIGSVLRLHGDWVPDQRLIDYLVCPLSTDQSSALDGTLGNEERLKADLAQMGVFDRRMAFYTLYRQRLFQRMGFCGFEGRYYSQFADLAQDMAAATDLQRFVTAMAYRLILNGAVTHEDIPDSPDVESERRQIFFGACIGIPTFFVSSQTRNRFLRAILSRTARTRASRRYPGRVRVYRSEYCRALISLLEQEGADLMEMLGLQDMMAELKRRIEAPEECSALYKLLRGILEESGATSPLSIPAHEFNTAAERYYRGTLHRRYIRQALELFDRDLRTLTDLAAAGAEDYQVALAGILNGEDARTFVETVRENVADGRVSQSVVTKLIWLELLVIRHQLDRY